MKHTKFLHSAPPLAALTWLALCPATSNAATPADVEMAANIDTIDIVVEVDGQAETISAHPLQKPAGSLQLVLPLSIFGLPGGQTAIANGSINGSNIVWSFDRSLSVDIGDWADINRVHGWFKVQVTPFSFWDRLFCELDGLCSRNVKLSLVDSSIIMEGENVFGGGWSEPVYLHVFDAEAGPGFPHLASVFGPTTMDGVKIGAPTGSVESLDLSLHMTQLSPVGGTVVEIDTSIPAGHGFSHNQSVLIPAGSKYGQARFSAHNHFRGNVEVTFSTGKSRWTRTITVKEPPRKGVKKPWEVEEAWIWVPWCINCGDLVDWLDPLSPLVQLEDEFFLFSGEEPYALRSPVEASLSEVAAVGLNGWVTGQLGRAQTFVGQFQHGEFASFQLLGDLEQDFGSFEALDIDGAGTVYGAWRHEEGPAVAAFWPQGAAEPVLLPDAGEESLITSSNEYGDFVGSGYEGTAFIGALGGELRMLELPDGALGMELHAINSSGVAVGHIQYDDVQVPFRTTIDGDIEFLEEVDGTATLIDDSGLIFGNHSSGESAFVWMDEEGAVDFGEFVAPEGEVQAVRVLHLLADGSVVFDALNEEREVTAHVAH